MTHDEFAMMFATRIAKSVTYILWYDPCSEEWRWKGMKNQPVGPASAQNWINSYMVARIQELNGKAGTKYNLYGVYPILEKILGDIWINEINEEVYG